MLLFQKRFHAGLQSGEITVTFRRWERARVKPGGRYRVHPIGVVEVDAVQRVKLRGVAERDARAAGFRSLGELTGYLAEVSAGPMREGDELFLIRLHYGG